MLLLSGPSPDRVGAAAATVRGLGRGLDATPGLQWGTHCTDKPAQLPLGFAGRLPGGLQVAVGFRRRLHELKPSLVHLCFASEPDGWGLREASVHVGLARRAGARVVLHLHGRQLAPFLRRRPVQRELFRTLFADAHSAVVGSEAAADVLRELDVPQHRVFVVPPGLPAGPYAAPAPRLPTEAHPLRLVVLGGRHRTPCLELLVDALERVARARGRRLETLVLGAASPAFAHDTERLEAVGLVLGGPARPDDVAGHLDAADGTLLLDPGDAPPWSALEAMAACRPVLASASGAAPALFEGGAGDLVEADDAAALAAGLLRWVDDADHRLDVAAAGWHRVQRRHSVDAMMEAVHAAWAATLGCAPDDFVGAMARASA